MIDIDTLLTEVPQDPPCGPDLEYDHGFIALEQAARRRPEQQFGETTVAAEEPNWSEVLDRALALMLRTKDLRVAILITRALTSLEDMGGLAAGLVLIHGLMERYWDSVHPQLDPEDGYDPTMRLNALAPLGDPDTLLRDVRNMHLVRPGRHGGVAVRSVLIAMGKLSASNDDAVLTRTEIEGMIRAAAADDALPIEALRTSIQSLKALRTLLSDKVGIERVPDLKSLQELLGLLLQVCDAALGVSAEAQEQPIQIASEGMAEPVHPLTTEIRSREDAVRLLQRVIEYIERTEPTNPAPLFIRRAQRLMIKSFVEIIQELVPESLGQIQKLAGLEGE